MLPLALAGCMASAGANGGMGMAAGNRQADVDELTSSHLWVSWLLQPSTWRLLVKLSARHRLVWAFRSWYVAWVGVRSTQCWVVCEVQGSTWRLFVKLSARHRLLPPFWNR